MPAFRAADVERETGEHPRLGSYEALVFSEAGGLTQFGAAVETLPPGAASSDRHWHEAEDEFAYVLDGALTLVEDGGETPLHPGDAACWKAGAQVGHHLVNRSDRPATFLIVGTRAANDRVHYSELDQLVTKRDGRKTVTRRDGTPVEGA
jgi:uncharacterized cupin superfamily protein